MKAQTKVISILFLLLSLLHCTPRQEMGQNKGSYVKATPKFQYIPAGTTKLTGGVLADRCDNNIENLYLKISVDSLKNVFKETHDRWYAEPEFAGHYLACGPNIYHTSGNEEVMKRNTDLVQTIIDYQREDGYLGMYHEGMEFDWTFSVWNQNFVIKGLLKQYAETGNEAALQAAMKCANYNANAFLKEDAELLLGVNQGIQHSTILEEIANLYTITGKQLYLDFANYIIDRLERSSIKVVSTPNDIEWWASPTMLGSTKGLEMLIVYFGVLKMYQVTGDERYLTAAQNYFKALRHTQIRITGNGTLTENWNLGGNKPVELSNDMRPNENCVAMAYMKLAADLSLFTGDASYYDELENTLYNHMLGSQAHDGHDFSYYQGNIGYKIHEKEPGAYSCCRYRGMRILANLPQYVYMQSDAGIAVNLFTPSTTTATIDGVDVALVQQTSYPQDGLVSIDVKPAADLNFALLIRKPAWSEDVTVVVDGSELSCEEENGYLILEKEWSASGAKVEVNIEMTSSFKKAEMNRQQHAAVKYGPLVLSIDSRYGTPIESTKIKLTEKPELVSLMDGVEDWTPQVKFQVSGMVHGKQQMVTLVDYASAGSIDAGVDQFRLWIPVYE